MQILFPKEEEIMYAIWDIGHPCAISELLKHHPELKRNTVAKVLVILEQKGYLTVDSIVKTITRTGRAYTPIITKESYEAQKDLIHQITESPSAQDGILAYCSTLLNTGKFHPEFVEEMNHLIAAYKDEEE